MGLDLILLEYPKCCYQVPPTKPTNTQRICNEGTLKLSFLLTEESWSKYIWITMVCSCMVCFEKLRCQLEQHKQQYEKHKCEAEKNKCLQRSTGVKWRNTS